MTSEFNKLLQIDANLRDNAWEAQFFAGFIHQPLRIVHSSPQAGPDGFSYLLAEIADGPGEPAAQVVNWLSSRGIGLVLNPRKTYPDYVFTYGMLWNFRERGEFQTRVVRSAIEARVEFKSGQQVWVVQPTASYLPADARTLLKQFFLDQGLLRPRVVLVSADQAHYDLAFSIESLGQPPEIEHRGIAEAISWFLPAHYSVALVSEKNLTGFVDL
jgi:hypothetical protein